MNSALDENKSKLGVLVLAVSLQMLSDGDRLLNQVVEILRESRGKSSLLEDAEDLVAGDPADLGDAVPISQHDTNLRGSHALLGELGNVVDHIVSGELKPLQN